MNLPVLLFSGAILFVTAALVLLLREMQASRFEFASGLREGARTSSGTAGNTTIRNLLVGSIAIPHAVAVDGHVMRLFDPANHEAWPDTASDSRGYHDNGEDKLGPLRRCASERTTSLCWCSS